MPKKKSTARREPKFEDEGNARNWADCLRNPVVMRIVTNVVLTVSDTDFFLSWLFSYELYLHWEIDFKWMIFSVLIWLGQITYVIGICWYGPKQEKEVMKKVMDMMYEVPDVFESCKLKLKPSGEFVRVIDLVEWENPKNMPVIVTPSSMLVVPGDQPAKNDTARNDPDAAKTFEDLDPSDFQHQQIFFQALTDWGVLAVYIACQSKNAINSLQFVHGCPIMRTARFGFMAVPPPKDLAGLLNANALYSFATGITQLFVGVLLCRAYGSQFELVLPMSVASISLVLCTLNVWFDFGAVLCELEGETLQQERIWGKLQQKLADDKKDAGQRHKIEVQRIEKEYEDLRKSRPTNALTDYEMLGRRDKLANQQCRYGIELDGLNSNAMGLIRTELKAYRDNLAEKKQLLAADGFKNYVRKETNLDAQTALDQRRVYNDMVRRTHEAFAADLKKLENNFRGLDKQDAFDEAMRKLVQQRNARLESLKLLDAGDPQAPTLLVTNGSGSSSPQDAAKATTSSSGQPKRKLRPSQLPSTGLQAPFLTTDESGTDNDRSSRSRNWGW